jgi:capsular polysaccharide transport system permease protein
MSLPTSSLRQSFAIQLRVIGALIMREIITRYGRHNIGFLWLFVEPMLFTVGVTTLWSLAGMTHGSALPITAFAVTGYSSLLLWRNCSNRAVRAVEVNTALLYHRYVKVFDLFAARLILEIVGATSSCIVLTIIFTAVGWMDAPADILTALIGWLLLAWFAFGLGLVVGAVSERSEVMERVWHVMTYLMFPLSGSGFMLDWFPSVVRNYLLMVPMVHGTEMMRHGYFGTQVHTYEDPIFLLIVDAVLFLFGLALVKECSLRVEPE